MLKDFRLEIHQRIEIRPSEESAFWSCPHGWSKHLAGWSSSQRPSAWAFNRAHAEGSGQGCGYPRPGPL